MLDIPNLSSSTGRSSSARLLGRQSRRNLAFVAAAAPLALCFLGGMSAPAVAFHHWHNRLYASADGGSESRGWRQSHRRRGSAETAESGRPGKPAPAKQPSGPLILAISLGNQRVTVYDNGTPVAVSAVSTGVPGHPTPLGVFSVIQKQRWHHSNLYSNAPMPYMQRITWSGVALHAGVVPGHPASHGCIRLPERFAVRLWGMTKVGARVIITRGSAAPYEINHPRLAGLVAASEGAVDAGAVNARSSASKPSAVVVAATGTATADVPGTEVAHDDAEHSGSGSGADASASPQGGTGDSQDKPAETGQTPEPSTVEPSPAQKIDAALQRPGPLSLFVSRKLGKLFVRKGFTPVFDTPVTIAHPEVPLGTHVFTAIRPTNEGGSVRWLAVSIGDRTAARPAPAKHKGRAARDERPAAPDALHQAAAEALDRIELPPEALEHIVPLVTPGASLLISDQGLGNETGRDTDFIVVTR